MTRTRALEFVLLAMLFGCPQPARSNPLDPIRTVFLIMMENESWSDIVGNTNAPYINSVLLPMASHCEQYYDLPGAKYLWYEAGTNFGIASTDSPFTNNCQTPEQVQTTTNHLTTYLYNAGISWKAYLEDSPTNIIELAGYNHYVVRHNPFAFFTDITGTNITTYCTSAFPYGVQHLRPYTEFAADLASNTVARYNFIVPNLCDDMHDVCAPLTNRMLQGDTWLSSEIPRILNSSAYQHGGAVFITWDESSTGTLPIGMLVLSPFAKGGGYASTVYYTPLSTLRSMQEIFHVGPWLGAAGDATDLGDLFRQLEISQITLGPGPSVQLGITGVTPGVTNVVQASTDLSHWTNLSTNSVTSDSFSFTDYPTNEFSRFYRVVEWQSGP
ncbi:MAG TPA: alkaline phosphatase family protein [Verrucomicrobiae bacterium]|nr:alkaline phosphatase family protein [Verrucomicrobiae bacterium]